MPGCSKYRKDQCLKNQADCEWIVGKGCQKYNRTTQTPSDLDVRKETIHSCTKKRVFICIPPFDVDMDQDSKIYDRFVVNDAQALIDILNACQGLSTETTFFVLAASLESDRSKHVQGMLEAIQKHFFENPLFLKQIIVIHETCNAEYVIQTSDGKFGRVWNVFYGYNPAYSFYQGNAKSIHNTKKVASTPIYNLWTGIEACKQYFKNVDLLKQRNLTTTDEYRKYVKDLKSKIHDSIAHIKTVDEDFFKANIGNNTLEKMPLLRDKGTPYPSAIKAPVETLIKLMTDVQCTEDAFNFNYNFTISGTITSTPQFKRLAHLFPKSQNVFRQQEKKRAFIDKITSENLLSFFTLQKQSLRTYWWYQDYVLYDLFCINNRMKQFTGTCWFTSAVNALVLSPVIAKIIRQRLVGFQPIKDSSVDPFVSCIHLQQENKRYFFQLLFHRLLNQNERFTYDRQANTKPLNASYIGARLLGLADEPGWPMYALSEILKCLFIEKREYLFQSKVSNRKYYRIELRPTSKSQGMKLNRFELYDKDTPNEYIFKVFVQSNLELDRVCRDGSTIFTLQSAIIRPYVGHFIVCFICRGKGYIYDSIYRHNITLCDWWIPVQLNKCLQSMYAHSRTSTTLPSHEYRFSVSIYVKE